MEESRKKRYREEGRETENDTSPAAKLPRTTTEHVSGGEAGQATDTHSRELPQPEDTATTTSIPPPVTPDRDGTPLSHHHSTASHSHQQQPVVIYIVGKKIPSGQLSHLKTVAGRKEFSLSSSMNDSVTHVVSALPTLERVEAALLSISSSLPEGVEVVTLDWLTSSFQEGHPLQVTDRYRLRKKTAAAERSQLVAMQQYRKDSFELPEYECQRVTLLNHHNPQLSEALEQLECYYQYKDDESRALAFRQASCTVKALPQKVTHIDQVSNLPRIGRHSKLVIQEILRSGFSQEVEECRNSEWFQCMKLFTSIYGCGTATANRWYSKGLRTVEDITRCTDLNLTNTQTLGLRYYDDLSVPIPRDETAFITAYIRRQAEICFPGTSVEAVGGYRRGKPYSHDVDLLLTHPDTAVTDVLLDNLLRHLRTEGVVIHADVSTGHNTPQHIYHDHRNTSGHTFTPSGKHRRVVFDHLDKAFCILALDTSELQSEGGSTEEMAQQERRKGWRGSAGDDRGTNEKDKEEGEVGGQEDRHPSTIIRRVDLIVSPSDQYPFALVSWTGSKQFNRSLRRYSVKECGMSVTAHGVYNMMEGKFVPASTERDVFAILKINYLEPWERNC